MKILKHFSSLAIVMLLPLLMSGQQESITSAFQKGKAADLKSYMASSVDLILPDTEGTFTADKAVSVLNEFFTNSPVKNYKVMHVNTPQQGRSNYAIGELTNSQGSYRTTIYFDGQKKISEIRIQK